MRPCTKRVLSLLLCLVMLGTFLPASGAPRETVLLPDSSAAVVNAAKPTITTQPKSITKNAGETGKFTVKASGATQYQWYWRKNSDSSWAKSTASSATIATLSLKATMARNGCQYRCKVSNSSGYVYTKTVTFTVIGKPEIATQPKSVTKNVGETGKFTVKADGASAYQWYWRKNSNSSWAKSTASSAAAATLSLKATMARNGCQYRCKVSNSNGSVYTKTVTLTVNYAIEITSQPVSVSIAEGGTAAFTVTAKNAEAYQWYWWNAEDSQWVKCTGAAAQTAVLTYTDVRYGWNGYRFCCKVSNSAGYVWTDEVSLLITGRHTPVITTQPKSAALYEGGNASFTVKAKYADSYQWYCWEDSETGWVKCTGAAARTATLSYTDVRYGWNGIRFRCKVMNSEYSVFTDTVTLSVDPVTYRALLVAEVNFYSMDAAPRFQGSADLVANMLQSVKGPMGRAYTVTSVTDVGLAGLEDAIDNTFAGADDNDVSLFYIVTHGETDYASGTHAGELVLAGPYGDVRITLERLADCLLAVPGKVIVFLDSCGSGAAVWEGNGAPSDGEQAAAEAAAFNEAAIAAFAEAEASLASPNTGEFIDPKFYVITSAAHQETSWGSTALNYTYFGYYLALGPLGRKPADEEGDGNGTVTLNELYNYVYTHALGPHASGGNYYQHAQVYPENSSYELFK